MEWTSLIRNFFGRAPRRPMQSEPATVEQAVRFTHHARKLGVDTTARWMKARRLTRLRDVPPEERDAVITEFETVQPK